MRKTVLVLVETVDDYLPMLEQAGYRLIRAPSPQLRADAIQRHASEIDAVLTRGPLGLTAAEIDALPKLQIICVIGAGYEQVDLAAAAARGITVTNGAGANASAVADHTLALLLALLRDIPCADASTRRGEWNRVISPSVSGKRLGILGLGAVGQAIASAPTWASTCPSAITAARCAKMCLTPGTTARSTWPKLSTSWSWPPPVAPIRSIWSMPRY